PVLSIGDHFDRYVVESVLGRGGMGIVYRALDPRLGRRVALKVVALGEGGSTPDAAARLVREARAAAALDHPNAVAIFDVDGVAVGTPLYMAPEQIRGAPVDARSDQFSWGVVAYELLSGKSPWGRANDLLALAVAISNDPARPLADNAAGVSRQVADVVMRA